MLLVRTKVGNAGVKFAKTDDALFLPSKITGFENPKTLSYDAGGAPASFPNQQNEAPFGSLVESSLNGCAHT